MQSVGEVALSRERGPAEYRQALANMLEEVQRLTRVTDQLLRLARLERTEIRASFIQTDIGQIVRRAGELFQSPCDEKQVGLRMEAEDGIQSWAMKTC